MSPDGTLRNDYRTLLTDNRIVANALVGLGYEFGNNTVRWTNVYIHDTLKQGADRRPRSTTTPAACVSSRTPTGSSAS